MYKTLSSRTLLTHPRLTVVEDIVELKDGQTGDYVRFDGKRDAVGLIVRRPDGAILVQQEYSYVPGVRLYQLPGGGMESGETPDQAARRELAEEAALSVQNLTLLGSYFMDHRRSAGRMFLFLAEELDDLPNKETRQKDKYEVDLTHEWRTEREVAGLIAGGKVVNVHFLAAWTLYKTFSQTRP